MFLLSQTTKISPKTGPKTQKSASGPGHLRNRKKRCCKPKNWGQKVEKTHRFFHFSLADFGRARSRTGVFRTVFYSVFWRRASRPIKNRRFWPKNAPPPGKPVTFYECHPEDHAPAPSVRADLSIILFSFEHCFDGTKYPTERQTWQLAPPNRFLPLTSRAFLSRNSWDVMGHVLCYVKLDMRSSFISTAHMGPNMGHCYIWYEIQLN